MQLRLTTDYSIRLMVYLARSGRGKVVSGRELSQGIGITPGYLGKTMLNLRQWGLLSSEQGPLGGFVLMRNPAEITLYEIITACESTIKFNRCLEADEHCGLSATEHCKVHKALGDLQQEFEARLQSIKLTDLI